MMGTPKAAPLFVPLTDREQDILKLLAEDLSDREIADRLVVAPTTVKWYNRQIFNKLGVESRKEAVAQAQALGLLASAETQPLPAHNLPAQLTPFIGRTDELRDLNELLLNPPARLITILASGGMGKTRLALATAELALPHFPDGVFFVQLAPLTEINQLIPAIADSIGYQFSNDRRSIHQQLLDYLRAKQVLLLLDNFEHLLDAAALLSDLLQTAPRATILVTSRERLNIQGETVYAISGLTYPVGTSVADAANYPAVRLFTECAQRVSTHGMSDVDTAARICQLVQGMPLALELAAAWVGTLPLAQIEAEIRHTADFLRTTMRNVPERLRSVRAVFETTWQRLSVTEQQVFSQLSVFRGGFTVDAAQAVTGASLDVLAALVDKALVWRNHTSERCEIHELLRQYAAAALESAGNADHTREQHRRYFTAYAQQWANALKTPQQLIALDQIDADLENIREAFEQSIALGTPEALDPLADLWYYYEIRGRWMDGEKLFAAAVAALEPTESVALAKMLAAQMVCLDRITVPERWWGMAERSEKILRNFGAEKGFLLPFWYKGAMYSDLFDHATATQIYLDVLELAHQSGDQWAAGMVLTLLGREANAAGQHEAARTYLTQALTLLTTLGNVARMAYALYMLGNVALDEHDIAQAEKHFEMALLHAQRARNPLIMDGGMTGLIFVATARRELDLAKRLAEDLLTLRRNVGRFVSSLRALNLLIDIELELGEYEPARECVHDLLSTPPTEIPADVLADLSFLAAKLFLFDQNPKLATEIFSFFLAHSNSESKPIFPDSQQQLQAQLELVLPPDRYHEAMERGKAYTAETLLTALHSLL